MGPSGKGHCKLLYGDWGIDEEVELEEFHDYSSRSETDIVNVVEQRIWHSMEEGHFENLPGKGKPLDLSTNPHADPAEDTLYRILSKNGCAPEWVELNKEIRRKITEWRLAMKKLWADISNHDDDSKWIQDYETLKPQVREINDMIFKAEFNCPCWFSTSTKKLIKRILDPNPITRITISKVIGNEWFKKGYQSPSFETPDIDIDDVQAIFDAEPSNYIVKRREEKPVLMNAFELISTSQGLNLGSLFEKQMGLVKRETRFWITVKLKLIDGDKSKAIGIVGDLHLGATFEDFEACTIKLFVDRLLLRCSVSILFYMGVIGHVEHPHKFISNYLAATPMGFNVQKQNYKLRLLYSNLEQVLSHYGMAC